MPPGRLPEHLPLRRHHTTLDGRIAFYGEAGEEPPAWERLAGSVDDLHDHLAPDHQPAFLVSHSSGGGVATMTAWHHPERARSLVLVNPVGGSVWRSERTPAERRRARRDRPA